MKKLILRELIFFLLVGVFACFAQQSQVVKKQEVHVLKATAAHTATLTWTNPTTCTDGSACTPAGNQVYKLAAACPASGTTGFTLLYTSSSAITTYADTTVTAPGTYCYYVTALTPTTLVASAPSNTAGGSLSQPAINAPSAFTVTIQ